MAEMKESWRVGWMALTKAQKRVDLRVGSMVETMAGSTAATRAGLTASMRAGWMAEMRVDSRVG